MEISQNFEAVSICSELNLNIQDLNIESLQSNVIYRRLYNIVAHDTNKTQYQYRKNLIKQLYFLLKITPIMKPELQNQYLEKLQKWYNSNDHKKTQLGSGLLRNLVQEYVSNKQTNDLKLYPRPQSGVNWNKNVNPFLRPYTAKRPNLSSRPESHKSKFGRSTKASAKLQSCQQISVRDFTLSIREQFQVSQDFLNKNRTIHAQSEPIYEQLFNIIKKAGIPLKINRKQPEDSQNQYLFQRDKQQFLNSPDNYLSINKKQSEVNQKQANDQFEEFDKVSEQSQKDQDEDKNQQEQNNFERKIYTRDLNLSKQKGKQIQGFCYLSNENQNDTFLLKKVNNKYSHVTNNKFVNYSKDDNEMVRNYVNYTRIKSSMKRQLNRKSQSKRLLSAKLRSNTNVSLTQVQSNKPKNQRIYSALPKRDSNSLPRNSDKKQISNLNGGKIFDFTQLGQQKQNHPVFVSSPTYNQRTQLDILYRRPIQQYKKLNKNNIAVAEIKSNDKKLLTKYDCFLTREKINPIADIYIQQHNQQALEEIQKIKQKVAGLGKKWLSTDSLMKALYIDSYDKIGSSTQINKPLNLLSNSASEKNMQKQQMKWQNKNVYFNMISNGQKKMKKKTRKLKSKPK